MSNDRDMYGGESFEVSGGVSGNTANSLAMKKTFNWAVVSGSLRNTNLNVETNNREGRRAAKRNKRLKPVQIDVTMLE